MQTFEKKEVISSLNAPKAVGPIFGCNKNRIFCVYVRAAWLGSSKR